MMAGVAPTASRKDAAYRYAVFGGTLCTNVAFEDLSPSHEARTDWTLRVVDAEPPTDADAEELGRQRVGKLEWRLTRSAAGLQLWFPPFGRCAIDPEGSELTWYLGDDRRLEFLRAAVLGPVLALALHEAGTLCLHGAAVGIGDQAIALVAPKHHGKSTLALALVRAGATLVTDDSIAVDPESAAVRPGVHSVRLWQDSADELAAHVAEGRLVSGAKSTLVDLPTRMLQRAPIRLSAVYVLVPVTETSSAGVPVERARIPDSVAAVLLTHHAKLVDSLIGPRMTGQKLRWASSLVRRVPVYTLAVVRDFAKLPQVADHLVRWHAQPSDGSHATA